MDSESSQQSEQSRANPASAGKPVTICVLATAMLVSAIAVWYRSNSQQPPLPAGISESEYAAAKASFKENFRREASHVETMMLLAELAVAEERLETAKIAFEQIPQEHEFKASALHQHAQICQRMNLAEEAEASLKSFIQLAQSGGTVPQANLLDGVQRLTYLLTVQLRWEERNEILQRLHEMNLPTLTDSIQLYFPSLVVWNSTAGSSPVRQFLEQAPGNQALQIANGRYLTGEGRLDEAKEILEPIWQESQEVSAAVGLLLCFYELDDWASIEATLKQCPTESDDEPIDLTVMRGRLAQHSEDWPECERLFRKVIESDSVNPIAHIACGLACQKNGNGEAAAEFRRRSKVIAQIRVHLSGVVQDAEQIGRLVELCEELPFDEAAAVFAAHANLARQESVGE